MRSLQRLASEAGDRLGRLSAARGMRVDFASLALALLVPGLVLLIDAQLALLAFLSLPLLALASAGRRRAVWCTLAVAGCAASALAASAPLGATAMRLPLVLADVCVVLALAQAFQQAAREAELRRRLSAEAHHRVKNSLQGVADLLYLARAGQDEEAGLERAAARIRSIAAVHELLGRDGGESVAVDELLRRGAAGPPAGAPGGGGPPAAAPRPAAA